MRVALFGGSFNPPHVAHQLVALYVLETAPVDQLWFIPCFQHAFGKPLAPFDDRFAMCGLAAAALGLRAQVSDVEREIAQPSRTLITVRALMARHPEHQFSWIVGGDLVPEIDSWYGAAELRRTVPFLIVGRASAALGRTGAAVSATVMMPAVSSTDVRRALADGKSVEGLVPRTVLDYIYQRGLYQAREPE
ncbi:MAG: nicotinate-nucleotide adenylyltransferase [Myxococcales bacterium]|jgi:nicotinate-nucleotide adenylyltransferase|nr:nicotinate-nucleotide adenylyltransferase [Myxococcales bacterium]